MTPRFYELREEQPLFFRRQRRSRGKTLWKPGWKWAIFLFCCCLYDSLCDSFQEDTQWLMLSRTYPSVVPFLFNSDESMPLADCGGSEPVCLPVLRPLRHFGCHLPLPGLSLWGRLFDMPRRLLTKCLSGEVPVERLTRQPATLLDPLGNGSSVSSSQLITASAGS